MLKANDPALIPLSELINQLPKRPCRTTLWRWISKGRRSKTGTTLKLPVIEIVGQYYTTPTALFSFIENTPKQKAAAGRTAARHAELKAAGLL